MIWIILRILLQHLLLLSLIRVYLIIFRQDIVFDIRSSSFLRWLLKAWGQIFILHNLISWNPSRTSCSLYFDLTGLRVAHFLIFLRHILLWLRGIRLNLITLLAVSSRFIFLELLFRFLAHLWLLRVITRSWVHGGINHLIWWSRLVCGILAVRQNFGVVLVLVLIKLILIPTPTGMSIFFFLTSITSPVHFWQIVNRVSPWVSSILLYTLRQILINEIILLLKITCGLRSLLVGATLSTRNYISWLRSWVALLGNVLGRALFVWIIFIDRLIWVVSIVLNSIVLRVALNIVCVLDDTSIWCARILWGLVSVSISRVDGVGFASASGIFHLWLAVFRCGCSS